MQVNNAQLKNGFIFILVDNFENYGPEFVVQRMGGIGYFAKLTNVSINGWEPVTHQEYMDA